MPVCECRLQQVTWHSTMIVTGEIPHLSNLQSKTKSRPYYMKHDYGEFPGFFPVYPFQKHKWITINNNFSKLTFFSYLSIVTQISYLSHEIQQYHCAILWRREYLGWMLSRIPILKIWNVKSGISKILKTKRLSKAYRTLSL